jgi:hypothetical protein
MTFFFDLDPWNGMSEDEMMESIVNDLTENSSAVIDDLREIIKNSDDFRPEEVSKAQELAERIEAFCR